MINFLPDGTKIRTKDEMGFCEEVQNGIVRGVCDYGHAVIGVGYIIEIPAPFDGYKFVAMYDHQFDVVVTP